MAKAAWKSDTGAITKCSGDLGIGVNLGQKERFKYISFKKKFMSENYHIFGIRTKHCKKLILISENPELNLKGYTELTTSVYFGSPILKETKLTRHVPHTYPINEVKDIIPES